MRRDESGGTRKSRGAKRKEEIESEEERNYDSVSFLKESPPLIIPSCARIFLAELIRNNCAFSKDLQW